MKNYLFLPISFLKFWFFEAPIGIYQYFSSLNHAFLKLFALTVFIKTFFKPLKNEYRPGLVRFSRFMGMGIKSILIMVDLILFIPLLVLECVFLISFVALPVLTVMTLFT